MPKKESTLVNALLFAAYAAGGVISLIAVTPHDRLQQVLFGGSYSSYRHGVYHLKRRGLITISEKNGKKFIKLTAKGELEILMAKAVIPTTGPWDGKWRILIFDIPKAGDHHRDKLRWLLKKNNFKKLQNSVYASPYPLNREAITYLQKTGLNEYIRIMKVEEMDYDKDLRKKFNLK